MPHAMAQGIDIIYLMVLMLIVLTLLIFFDDFATWLPSQIR